MCGAVPVTELIGCPKSTSYVSDSLPSWTRVAASRNIDCISHCMDLDGNRIVYPMVPGRKRNLPSADHPAIVAKGVNNRSRF